MIKVYKLLQSNWHTFLLLLLSLSVIVSVARYGMRSFQIPIWDEQHYMHMSAEYYRLLKHPTWSTPYEILRVIPSRQPGYALLFVPLYFVFGLSNAYFWAQVTNGVLFTATIAGIYCLAKLYLTRLASYLSALLFATYGWTLYFVTQTYSENGVSALCVFAILFLLKSSYFQKRNYSILFGLCLGMALLTKYISLIFVTGPLLYVGYTMLVNGAFRQKKVLLNMLLSLFICLLIVVYPYSIQFGYYFQNWFDHVPGGPVWETTSQKERDPFSLYTWTVYLNSFSKLGMVPFLLFVLGFIYSLKKPSKGKPVLLAFLGGYIFSALIIVKSERHILPIFPYVAILSASVFDVLRNPKLKIALIAVTVTVSLLSYLGSFWGKGPMSQSLVIMPLPIDLPYGELKKLYLTTVSRPPYLYKISGKEIVDYIATDSAASNIQNPRVARLFSYRQLDEPFYVYSQYYLEKPLQGVYLGSTVSDPDTDAERIVRVIFENSDYLLVKTGTRVHLYASESTYQSLEAALSLYDSFISDSDYFEKKATFWINQDSSEVTVLKNRRTISQAKIREITKAFSREISTKMKAMSGTFAEE